MKIRAEQKNTRQSPRKVRLVANQIKDLSLEKAFVQLSLMERRASLVLLKVLRQAVANATNNHQLSIQDLEIEQIVVKTGSTYKRMRAVSRGRGHRILKRTCHVEVVLTTKPETAVKDQPKKQVVNKKTGVSKKTDEKTDKKVEKTAEKPAKIDLAKQSAKLKKSAPANLKDQTKIKQPRNIQQPVTKIHRRKSGA